MCVCIYMLALYSFAPNSVHLPNCIPHKDEKLLNLDVTPYPATSGFTYFLGLSKIPD